MHNSVLRMLLLLFSIKKIRNWIIITNYVAIGLIPSFLNLRMVFIEVSNSEAKLDICLVIDVEF